MARGIWLGTRSYDRTITFILLSHHFAVKPKVPRLFYESVVYGQLMVGDLTVLSLSLSVQKSHAKTGLLVPMPVDVILRWTVPLAAALAECSPSNKTSENKRVNYKRRWKLPTTLSSFTLSSTAS